MSRLVPVPKLNCSCINLKLRKVNIFFKNDFRATPHPITLSELRVGGQRPSYECATIDEAFPSFHRETWGEN